MRKAFQAIVRAFTGDPGNPTEIDYAPIGGQTLPAPSATVEKPKADPAPPDWKKKRDEAAKRFGKPFAPDLKVSRVTQPSHTLEHINAQTDQARKVTHISTRRKS